MGEFDCVICFLTANAVDALIFAKLEHVPMFSRLWNGGNSVPYRRIEVTPLGREFPIKANLNTKVLFKINGELKYRVFLPNMQVAALFCEIWRNRGKGRTASYSPNESDLLRPF